MYPPYTLCKNAIFRISNIFPIKQNIEKNALYYTFTFTFMITCMYTKYEINKNDILRDANFFMFSANFFILYVFNFMFISFSPLCKSIFSKNLYDHTNNYFFQIDYLRNIPKLHFFAPQNHGRNRKIKAFTAMVNNSTEYLKRERIVKGCGITEDFQRNGEFH